MTVFTDSHCHLAMVEEEKATAALERARSAGVRGFVVPGTNLQDAAAAVRTGQRFEGVWSAVGFHPHDARDCSDEAFAEIERLSSEARVVAIGEVGLDYHYMHSPREVQREVLLRHANLARRRELPLIIHNRESTADLLDLIRGDEFHGIRGILHSFTETWSVAEELIDRGYWISFSGIVTFRSADSLREVALRTPLDRMLIETDTPYLAPVPHRGKENEPSFVIPVAELIASLRGISVEEVAEATTSNFEKVFGVEVPR